MHTPPIALIGVPSSAGARRAGQEGAPAALRAAGLVERLRGEGLEVVDLGDLPTVTFRPDTHHPRRQNLPLVEAVARTVAYRVGWAAAGDAWPIVVGGDCSVSLGVIAGLARHHPRLGLAYFDADLDCNTPETSPSGVFDGMVLAHVLGRGVPQLAGIGLRRPLLSEDDVVLFAYDEGSGWIDPPELEFLERTHLSRYPLARVLADPVAAARSALVELESRSDAFLVHFDVDATNIPAVDVPHPGGMDPTAAFGALEVFLAAPTCVGMVVTELNPERDADGSSVARVAQGLVEALAARRAVSGSSTPAGA